MCSGAVAESGSLYKSGGWRAGPAPCCSLWLRLSSSMSFCESDRRRSSAVARSLARSGALPPSMSLHQLSDLAHYCGDSNEACPLSSYASHSAGVLSVFVPLRCSGVATAMDRLFWRRAQGPGCIFYFCRVLFAKLYNCVVSG